MGTRTRHLLFAQGFKSPFKTQYSPCLCCTVQTQWIIHSFVSGISIWKSGNCYRNKKICQKMITKWKLSHCSKHWVQIKISRSLVCPLCRLSGFLWCQKQTAVILKEKRHVFLFSFVHSSSFNKDVIPARCVNLFWCIHAQLTSFNFWSAQ